MTFFWVFWGFWGFIGIVLENAESGPRKMAIFVGFSGPKRGFGLFLSKGSDSMVIGPVHLV